MLRIKKSTIRTIVQMLALVMMFIVVPVIAGVWIELEMINDFEGAAALSFAFAAAMFFAKKGKMTI